MNRHTPGPLIFVIAALLAATIVVVPSLASTTPQTPQDPESGTWLDKPRGTLGFLDRSAPSGRQGGENWATATPIPELPAIVTGTTCGYDTDCGDFCGGWESLGPDVVYSYVATADTAIALDACGSSFDTMIFVWDAELNMVACNDDRWGPIDDCGQYTSRMERVPVEAGVLYYIVMAGWSGCGDYIMEVEYYEPCELECTGVPEGEPALDDGYVDMYNGGCNQGGVFQHLSGDTAGGLVLCGKSGWFERPGADDHDWDWFVATLGSSGILEWTLDSDQWTAGSIRAPADCESMVVVAEFETDLCGSGSLIYQGEPGETLFLRIHPGSQSPPPHFIGHEYDYVCTFSGLQSSVAVEQRSWSAVKGLFTEPRERYGKRARE